MPRREKLRTREKVEIVGQCLRGESSISEASHQAGADRETVRQWIIGYETEGAAGFLPIKRNRKYSPEKKLQAAEEFLSGKGSQVEISRKYGLRSKTQLQNWIKVYYSHEDFNSGKYSGGESYMKQGRETTLEERIQLVRECITGGKNYGEMALKYQVSYQQVRLNALL